MLVLSRKQNQQIVIGDNVTITILRVRGNTVRIGIDAPRNIHVMRGELEKEHEIESDNQSVTVEFRNNDHSEKTTPRLRVVSGQSIDDQPGSPGQLPRPVRPPVVVDLSGNCLHDLVSKIGETRSATP